jgi:dipeptidyl aminopeptidase/acylaminoacyl peptidase
MTATATPTSTTSRPYGLWDSPVTPRMLAQGLRLSDVAWDSDGQTLVWLEGRSDRGVLVAARLDDPAPRDLTSDLSVRALVGYGGGDFTAGHGAVWFVSGGRIYRQPLAGGPARPVTPGYGNAAAPVVSPDGLWLLYVHSYEDTDVVAVVDAEGARWPGQLAQGYDFYMQPRWSRDARRVAWISWDHPNMPWDGTYLWQADIGLARNLPRTGQPRLVAGDEQTAVFQPEFSSDGGTLAYVANPDGWGQIYLHDLTSDTSRQLTHGEGERGRPAWAQGQRSYTWLGSDRIVSVRAERGVDRLQVIDVATGATRDVSDDGAGYGSFEQLAGSPDGRLVAAVASGPAQPPRVVTFALDDRGEVRVWARSMGETVPAAAYSTPEPVSWTSFDGEQAHGLFYPPRSQRFHGPGLPPLIVLVHGGPTGQSTASFHAQTQFFATRGYAVLEVNYRGSTGYGRDYMTKLRGSWGIYDVEDSISGARALAERGLVDPVKRVIMGGSAGGFTVLQTLVLHPGVFTAGICLFGVSNHFTLASDTHKFEARYLDSMLGPLPEAAAIYRERSPIFHADRIRDPIAVFQGTDDKVVPRAQSDEIVASLRGRGVPHEYHVYEGEGHGWRRSDTIESFYQAVDRFLRQYVVFA